MYNKMSILLLMRPKQKNKKIIKIPLKTTKSFKNEYLKVKIMIYL